MTAKSDAGPGITPEPVVVSRSFRAPRELVFRAWSSVDHLKRWFFSPPGNYTLTEAVVEFRPGGAFEFCMHAADGQDFRMRGKHIEIEAPDRIVRAGTMTVGDVRKFTIRTTATFEADGDGTRLTIRQDYEFFDEAFSASGGREGLIVVLDRLDGEIERMKIEGDVTRSAVHGSFTLNRRYDAAPSVVFHALTDPAAKARWFTGGEGYTTLERQMDVRPGGRERLKGRWATGLVATFDAVYFDVVPDTRLVYAYEMHLDDRKISVSLATMALEPDGAGTKLTVTEHGVFLDGYDDSGSREHGTAGLLDRLGASLQES